MRKLSGSYLSVGPKELEKANIGELYAEAKQLEGSVLDYLVADKEFQRKHIEFYRFDLLDRRRKTIVEQLPRAAKAAGVEPEHLTLLSSPLSEEGNITRLMDLTLPKRGE